MPIVARLFASTDRGIRRGLLENLASFGPSLPAALVESEVYGHVAGGFADANPYLRELTLKSMVVLGPKLSQKTLTQSLLKHLAKLQVGGHRPHRPAPLKQRRTSRSALLRPLPASQPFLPAAAAPQHAACKRQTARVRPDGGGAAS